MDSIKLWLMKFTPMKAVIEFLDGKKQMIASLGAAGVATGTILVNLSNQGSPYLLHIAQTPEFAAASMGWIGFFNSLKGEKIRLGIETVIHGEGGDPDRAGTPANDAKVEAQEAKDAKK